MSYERDNVTLVERLRRMEPGTPYQNYADEAADRIADLEGTVADLTRLRPMEEAPRDGMPILGYMAPGWCVVRFYEPRGTWICSSTGQEVNPPVGWLPLLATGDPS